MAIKISVEKVVTNDGEKNYKITNIKCLPYKKLPFLYLNGENPVVFKNNDNNGMILKNEENLPSEIFINSIYSEKLFIKILAHISKAEEHLKKINEELSYLTPMQIPF